MTPVEVRLPDWVLASSVVKPTNLVSPMSLSSLYCTVLYCTDLAVVAGHSEDVVLPLIKLDASHWAGGGQHSSRNIFLIKKINK